MKTSTAIPVLVPRRYRWLPYLLIGLTLCAIPAGIYLIRVIETHFVEAAGGELQLAATEVAEKLDRMLFERRSDVLLTARMVSLRPSDPKYLVEYLKWIKTNFAPVYLSLTATDAQGTVVASTEPSLVGRDYSLSAAFMAVRATRRLDIADVAGLEMEESEVDTIAFTAPILDAQGTFLGVVTFRVGVPFIAEVTTRTIRSLEARPKMGGRAEYEMLTKQGNVFATSDLSSKKGDNNLKELGISSVRLSEAGIPGFIEEEHLRRHIQVVTGYAQTKGFGGFPGLGWSVLVRMDRQDILAPIHAYFWKVGVIGGTAWIFIMGLLLWATTRLRTEHLQAQQESAWAKAAEAALLQSQERNRAIVDTALDGVITIDSTGIVTDWNA
ncbi:MAG: cache domain-containing protein, partial [Nitrospira sp.]|nr:cache domain-containing protein [Nitrospira sp.]